MHALDGAETIADLKAISQNLMHSSLTITDQVYGVLGADDQAARIGALGSGRRRAAAKRMRRSMRSRLNSWHGWKGANDER